MTDTQATTAEKSTDGALTKVFVRDMAEKQTVHSHFLVRDKAYLVGKNGKPYISMFLTDSSGSCDARIWDNVDVLNETFHNGDVVRVKGQIQLFQGRRQFVVHRLEKALADEFNMDDFITRSARPPEVMFAELLQLVEKMENPSIRQLTLDVLNDAEIRTRFLVAPAAKSIHHAYEGGLLEHILSICGLMMVLHAHYARFGTELKLDLLLFGAIFHDLGKIWELDIGQGISYTDKGKLLGHMVMAVELVEKKASRILGFPDELKDILKHIILSHHGRLEYGSPKTPMFLEAFLVAAIDDLDSKVNTIDMFMKSERQTGDRWSKYNQLFDRYFFLKI
jgi:3'-5' exoribonuclease